MIKRFFVVVIIVLLFTQLAMPSPIFPEDEYNVAAEKLPVLVGGLEGVVKKLSYPESALKNSIQGTVYLLVYIGTEGSIDDIKVVKSLGYGCDEEAIKVVRHSKFIPGEQGGIKIKTKMAVPIKFKLRL